MEKTTRMYSFPLMKCFCIALCVLIIATEITTTAPTYADYENFRDLYELLMQKEAIEDRLGKHQIVRKSNRSPSLRLRFGRRSDPSIPLLNSPFSMSQSNQDDAEN
ncbi:short neuropeptide F-like [Chrysoperla carnea]|uniref:short neuropeptide F-like n=1 Tax=Chrysoperla carnea TaxID=189513 RepID=UPI001D098E39|nr:short neuropeptide F-like [Chrysoperla carnea]